MSTRVRAARGPSLLTQLREATRERHAALESAMGPEVTRSRASYARFLAGSFVAVSALEDQVERALGAEYLAQRGALLRADLEALGVEVPRVAPDHVPVGEAAAFGRAYVIEGSALGGVALAESVRRTQGLDVPTRYLSLRGGATAARWRWFLEQLSAFETRADRDARAECCRSAMVAFGAYADAFHAASPPA